MNDDIRGVLGAVLPPVEPPTRHTPDDLLAAGRRARRARRIAYASTAAVVLAVALVAAAVVPGAVNHLSTPAAAGPRTGADYPAIGGDQYRDDTTGTLSKRLRTAHAEAAPHVTVQPATWTDAKGKQVVDDLPLELTAQVDDAVPAYFTSGDVAEKNSHEELAITLYAPGTWKEAPATTDGFDDNGDSEYLAWCDSLMPVDRDELASAIDPEFGTCAKADGPGGERIYAYGTDMVKSASVDLTSFTVVAYREDHTAVSVSNRCGTYNEKFTKPTCDLEDLSYSVGQLTDLAVDAPSIPDVKTK
ncbi:MAG TPA: hypothetical protein VE172_00685 [Stackebrandtia sp.]|jgi:hypothetical protein|uniref:hypothetical protein n=1 Tax=Stackebrandtia sp. TaxID=2023065 RepID=UPI002D5F40A1|nr:hypothetical protein [Stackebrandtia sp.]HZE37305.1 hypothetical protein [Stackebrandtia sp.]